VNGAFLLTYCHPPRRETAKALGRRVFFYESKCCHSGSAKGRQRPGTGAYRRRSDRIKSTGLHCSVGPFETTIEGESYDQLMEIVTQCQKVAIKAGAPSVSAYVKIVYNPEGEVLTIDQKITKHHQ
jgi:uncharacterized protein YqgV (UPF0045/DUF77 family)